MRAERGQVSDAAREAGYPGTEILEIVVTVVLDIFANDFVSIGGTEAGFPRPDGAMGGRVPMTDSRPPRRRTFSRTWRWSGNRRLLLAAKLARLSRTCGRRYRNQSKPAVWRTQLNGRPAPIVLCATRRKILYGAINTWILRQQGRDYIGTYLDDKTKKSRRSAWPTALRFAHAHSVSRRMH